ncbi:MAG TPA: heme ABC transporter ATP-binding protein [Anaerolineae bacterium]|nr:heme ABC transporter ATP-binding protein [Anaerolineae bacterium]HID84767.1 heme ABC transporter ATP-binding protein [Anaerolineales bacterium]HIQ08541.1 heme ABC transporter ATP-binding protein [Anaerolineaceae bacterium]
MLRIAHLHAGYLSRPVLHDVTLEIAPGHITVLVGPNGAGKTTLIRALSGTLPRVRGQVTWQGHDLLRLPPQKRARFLAVVPQARHLPSAFTVRQAVALGRTPYLDWLGSLGQRDHQAVARALRLTQLEPLAERLLGHLSGGEQQRVLLARALAQETPVLLLDEPTTHLDLRHQMQILALVQRLARQENLAVLMVLHDLNLAARFADQVALLHQGRLVTLGPPKAVFTPERLARIYGLPIQVLHLPGQAFPWVVPHLPPEG